MLGETDMAQASLCIHTTAPIIKHYRFSWNTKTFKLLKANTNDIIVKPKKTKRGFIELSFKQRMEENSRNRKTDLVLALDFPYQMPKDRTRLLNRAKTILEEVNPYLCAVKINHHLTLPLGVFDGVQTLVNQAHKHELQVIMDCKVNDIGNTNQIIAEYYYDTGFDALIANPFIGWEEGLQPIFNEAHKQQRGVILLTYMSHKGATEGYGQTVIEAETGKPIAQYMSFAKNALKWNADGAVVGATVPEKIGQIRKILGETVPIYSPGIGAQGGTANAARKAGARYLIVGREITQSQDPVDTAKKLAKPPIN
jgi:orotidine-5'-phosphate decarboxylase